MLTHFHSTINAPKGPSGNSVPLSLSDYTNVADHNTSPDLIKGQGVKTFRAFYKLFAQKCYRYILIMRFIGKKVTYMIIYESNEV